MKNIFGVILLLFTFINSNLAQSSELIEYSFAVEGNCGMCMYRIQDAAIEAGAKTAEWDIDTKVLTIQIDESKTSVSKIRYAISIAGHDNGNFKTPDDIYDNLHFCCKYRKDDKVQNNSGHDDHDGHDHAILENVASNMISGHVYGLNENGNNEAMIGATVQFKGSELGTVTDENGFFQLAIPNEGSHEIEVSYLGFTTNSIKIEDNGEMEIILDPGHELKTVEISYKKRTTEISFVNTINSEKITREELCKAACCNLSESFETNPSVDVSFPDAITGTRTIQMLGLAGPYVQITRELIPDVRALSSIYGMSMTPGPWIESIQLIKGVGSVVNGYEGIAGQINVELKKPEKGEKLFLNGYVNNGGRVELNANMRHDLSKNVSTGILLHGKRLSEAHDRNDDGFTDMPMENDFVIANRWKFQSNGAFQGQLGVKLSRLNHEGGFHDHFTGASDDHENHWRMKSETDRKEIWGKIGYINPDNPENSIGLQMSYVDQDQESNFGINPYNNYQNSFYSNLIFQRIPNDTHTMRFGMSFNWDKIEENAGRGGFHERDEQVYGLFYEHTFQDEKKWSIIPGIRFDRHNQYGNFITPRIHAKYNFSENSIIRLVAGSGFKTASIFAENIGIFSTARQIIIEGENPDNPYGLDAERAWNYGINYTQGITLADKEFILSVDLNRTHFTNQIVVDWENPREVRFYNLDGSSFSNSVQIKVEYELLKNLDIRAAYRLFDVQTDYNEGRLEKPLVARHRSFVNMAYKTENDWHFDMTVNWNGSKRLPSTIDNPAEFQREAYSPNYFLVNAQIMKRWGDKFDWYLGAENLLNYRQNDAIIASDDAFGQYFDASIVWAPLFGSNIYMGFRYTL